MRAIHACRLPGSRSGLGALCLYLENRILAKIAPAQRKYLGLYAKTETTLAARASRLLARNMAILHGPAHIPLDLDRDGRSRFPGHALACFSHSGDCSFCLLAPESAPAAIDAELIQPDRDWRAAAWFKRFGLENLTPAEAACVWTIHECAIKIFGAENTLKICAGLARHWPFQNLSRSSCRLFGHSLHWRLHFASGHAICQAALAPLGKMAITWHSWREFLPPAVLNITSPC